MPAYIVTRPDLSGATAVAGHNSVVVFAADAADAEAMAKGLHPGDSGALWDASTPVAIVAATDMEGWRANVILQHPTTLAVVADVTYTGIAADVIDDLGDGLVILLNATASIAASIYTAATQVLTVAAIADSLGDHLVTVNFFPPVAYGLGQDVDVPSFLASTVDGGIAGADVTATFVADASVVPNVPVGFSS